MKKLTSLFPYLYLLLFILLFLGQLQRLQLTPTLAIYLSDLVIGVIIFVIILHKLFTHQTFHTTKFIYWPLGFSLIAFVSLILNSSVFGWLGSLHLFRWLLHASLLPITYDLIRNRMINYHMKRYLLIVSLGIAVAGLLQYIILPDTRFLLEFGWDNHLNRLISTIFDPGFTGIFLILGFILTLDAKILPGKVLGFQLPKFSLEFIQAIFQVSLGLTYARSAFLTLTLVLLVFAALTRRFKSTLTYLITFALIILLLPSTAGEGVDLTRTQSITSRITSTQTAASIAANHWLYGVGFNNYRAALDFPHTENIPTHTSGPDNSFVHIATTTGIIGLSFYIYWLIRAFSWSFSHSHTFFLTLFALAIHAFTNNTLFYPFATIWLWLLFAYELSQVHHSVNS